MYFIRHPEKLFPSPNNGFTQRARSADSAGAGYWAWLERVRHIPRPKSSMTQLVFAKSCKKL